MKTLFVLIVSTLLSTAAVSAADGFFIAIGGVNTERDGHKIEAEFGTIHTSPDGVEWQRVFHGGPVKEGFSHANNNMLRCLTYGNGRFVATGNPKAVVTSTDGREWQVVPAPGGAFSVAFGNGLFLAPNAYGFMASRGGREWRHTGLKPDFKVWGKDGAGHVRKIVFGNGVFVCVGDSGSASRAMARPGCIIAFSRRPNDPGAEICFCSATGVLSGSRKSRACRPARTA